MNKEKKPTKVLKDKYRKCLSSFGVGKIFLTHKILTIQENIDKFDHIKIKNFCSSINSVNEWNNMPHTELIYL